MGRTWGEDITGRSDSRWLADVGFGLRLSSTRGNSNRVFHIDIETCQDCGGAVKVIASSPLR